MRPNSLYGLLHNVQVGRRTRLRLSRLRVNAHGLGFARDGRDKDLACVSWRRELLAFVAEKLPAVELVAKRFWLEEAMPFGREHGVGMREKFNRLLTHTAEYRAQRSARVPPGSSASTL